ncbi:hypothetical protein DdX_22344 [Ditylenchus destructor]|uniref:Uncharacterized protein n=1 Tax=Ditylenchus destructor TaxID=166010 RepID=A0AAD4MFW7_9BILA|nr:hypothetical protein DdX_22344 [Ditylenchus destructor]
MRTNVGSLPMKGSHKNGGTTTRNPHNSQPHISHISQPTQLATHNSQPTQLATHNSQPMNGCELKLNYNFNQSHVSSEESRSNETIEPSQLNIGEVCYTYVVIRRNVANTDHLSGSITMNYGNNSLKWMSENARDTNERTGCQLIFSKASDHLTDDIEIGCWEKVNEDEAIGWNETVPFHSNTLVSLFHRSRIALFMKL